MHRYLALQKIVQLGSFSKAAAALGCTQSAISQSIASLENELSVKLLNRSRSGVKLTSEGAELYPCLEKMINQYNAARERAREICGLETGIVRIGATASTSVHWLPGLLKEFREQYPGVEFVLYQGDYSIIQDWIKTGKVDFGFITPKAVTGLETVFVKNGALLATLPENHPLAALDTVPLAQLAQEPFILVESGHYSEYLEAFKALNITPNIKYIIHDDYAIMTMVEAGLGVSILAELVLQRTHYNIALRPTEPPLYRNISIAYKDKASLSVASRRFIECILSHRDDLP